MGAKKRSSWPPRSGSAGSRVATILKSVSPTSAMRCVSSPCQCTSRSRPPIRFEFPVSAVSVRCCGRTHKRRRAPAGSPAAGDDEPLVANSHRDEPVRGVILHDDRQQVGASQKFGGEPVGRPAVELGGSTDSAQRSVLQDRDAVGEGQRLALVMGDVQNRQSRQFGVEAGDLVDHRPANLRVERRQRFVEQ